MFVYGIDTFVLVCAGADYGKKNVTLLSVRRLYQDVCVCVCLSKLQTKADEPCRQNTPSSRRRSVTLRGAFPQTATVVTVRPPEHVVTGNS